jgi:hypothetical protein
MPFMCLYRNPASRWLTPSSALSKRALENFCCDLAPSAEEAAANLDLARRLLPVVPHAISRAGQLLINLT